jgi:hypothetical protein
MELFLCQNRILAHNKGFIAQKGVSQLLFE